MNLIGFACRTQTLLFCALGVDIEKRRENIATLFLVNTKKGDGSYMAFKSMAELNQYIKDAINNSLLDEVAPIVKEQERQSVAYIVYGSYGNNYTNEPNVYRRRKDSGGLSDINNMNANLVGDGMLLIMNTTPMNPDYEPTGTSFNLATLVKDGGRYNYPEGVNTYGTFRQPRDFESEAVAALQGSGDHIDALKKGLNSYGIKTR